MKHLTGHSKNLYWKTTMAVIENQTFEKQTINLDDAIFKNCTFKGCTLIYSGGPLPRLHMNTILDCIWQFAGAAERTMTFLAALYQGGSNELVEYIFDQVRRMPPGLGEPPKK